MALNPQGVQGMIGHLNAAAGIAAAAPPAPAAGLPAGQQQQLQQQPGGSAAEQNGGMSGAAAESARTAAGLGTQQAGLGALANGSHVGAMAAAAAAAVANNPQLYRGLSAELQHLLKGISESSPTVCSS